MINKSKVIAIIQARSGSKGIPNKNIYMINGHPLISYTLYAASISKYIDEVLVSTDSEVYEKIAIEYGAIVPFLRNSEMSEDTVTSVDSLKWFIEKYIKIGNFVTNQDIIIELPSVSPFRTGEDIDLAIEKLVKTNSDSVISVVNTGEKHPTRLKSIQNDLISDFTKEFPEPIKMSRRQDLTPCYIRNGAIYVMTINTLLNETSRSGKISRPYEMPEERSVNIDNKFDLLTAKLLIENGYCNNFPALLKRRMLNEFKSNFDNIKPNLLITTNLEMFDIKTFERLSNFNYHYYPDADLNKTVELLNSQKWDFWIPSPCPPYIITTKLISNCKNLKLISTPSTGSTNINRIDFEKNSNVKINTLREHEDLANITASSEWTFFLILNALRKGKLIEKSVRSGYWRETENFMRGHQLSDKTLGVIGFGRIGSNISRYAKAFNMKVIAYDNREILFPDYVTKMNSIKEVAERCDIFCVCVHFDENTKLLINSDIINSLKKGTIFINTSRGEIVDENLLFEKLKSSEIENLSVDVISNEVDYKESNLFKNRNNYDNLTITPHIAGLSYESEYLAFYLTLNGINI